MEMYKLCYYLVHLAECNTCIWKDDLLALSWFWIRLGYWLLSGVKQTIFLGGFFNIIDVGIMQILCYFRV